MAVTQPTIDSMYFPIIAMLRFNMQLNPNIPLLFLLIERNENHLAFLVLTFATLSCNLTLI